jgi:hypothetical protein
MRAWTCCLLLAGCGAAPEAARDSQPPLSPLSFVTAGPAACSADQQARVTAAFLRGQRSSRSPEFEACLREHLNYDYQPCQGYDPFDGSDRTTQISHALEVSRSVNPITVGCDTREDVWSQTSQNDGYYHTNSEGMILTAALLDEAARVDSVMAEATIAGVIWHEAMHTHGYMHNQRSSTGGNCSCGYSMEPLHADLKHSLNGIVDQCIQVAAMANRAIVDVSVGPGVYGAPQTGDSFVGFAENAKYCSTTSCLGNENDVDWVTVPPGSLPAAVQRTTITPRAIAYAGANFGGASAMLDYGVHNATELSGLNGIGNDAIHSIWVPAGMTVHACSDDGGGGQCADLALPAADLTYLGGISYLQISPTVTTFPAPEFYGSRQSIGVGAWSLGATPLVQSLVIPPATTVTACTAGPEVASRSCQSFRNSPMDLGAVLDGHVSWIEVRPDGPTPR